MGHFDYAKSATCWRLADFRYAVNEDVLHERKIIIRQRRWHKGKCLSELELDFLSPYVWLGCAFQETQLKVSMWEAGEGSLPW